jgi:hypothetical protein
MASYLSLVARRAALASLAAALSCAASQDPEADRWFDRHTEALWLPLVGRYVEAEAAMKSPIENLMLPLDYHPNGRLRAVLRAAKSQMFADGTIFAESVTVEMLTAEGQPDGRLTAEGCLFDRGKKHGYCRGLVSVDKGSDRLKGRDMYFSIAEQFIKILSECEIHTSRIPAKLGSFS